MRKIEKQKLLRRLIDEQSEDMGTLLMYPEVISPTNITNSEILTELNVKEKASIILSVLGKMSYREIAQALKCSHMQAGRYIRSGFNKLRRTECVLSETCKKKNCNLECYKAHNRER